MIPPELSEGDVRLRGWRIEDEQAVLDHCQDLEIQRWTSVPVPYRRDDAACFVQGSPSRWAAGTASFAIVDASTDLVTGSISLMPTTEPKVAEIGFWVGPASRGRNVALTATRLVCRWGFSAMDLARIQWRAEVGNVASLVVAERAGFTREGQLRKGLWSRDTNADVWIASLLPGDQPSSPGRRTLPFSPVRLSAEQLLLRAPRAEDAAAVLIAARDRHIARWNPLNIDDRDQALAWIERRADWTSGTHASWLVCDAEDSEVLGCVSVHDIDTTHLNASIGYWTMPAARGHGHATAAIKLATDWTFTALQLRRVELVHAVENSLSCRVAERAGYMLEGTIRQGYKYGDGQWYDEHVHSRLMSDTEAAFTPSVSASPQQ